MSQCTYCGQPARYTLDDAPVCYDCQLRLEGVAVEDRPASIYHQLQQQHGHVMRMDLTSLYRTLWLAELASRIEWAGKLVGVQVESKSAVVQPTAAPQIIDQPKRSGPVKVHRRR